MPYTEFKNQVANKNVGALFARACTALGVTQSMGRVGSALDNAPAESFNSTLEHELLSRRRFATKDQARPPRFGGSPHLVVADEPPPPPSRL